MAKMANMLRPRPIKYLKAIYCATVVLCVKAHQRIRISIAHYDAIIFTAPERLAACISFAYIAQYRQAPPPSALTPISSYYDITA
jgi:hypothetical protein